jgi:hypothetical protein
MSRGMGRIEHDALAIVEANGKIDALSVAALVFFEDPTDALGEVTPSQIASVRRALGNLRRKGQVFRLGRAYVFGPGATAREVYASRTVAQDFAAKLRAMSGNAGLRGYPDLIELVASSAVASSAWRLRR